MRPAARGSAARAPRAPGDEREHAALRESDPEAFKIFAKIGQGHGAGADGALPPFDALQRALEHASAEFCSCLVPDADLSNQLNCLAPDAALDRLRKVKASPDVAVNWCLFLETVYDHPDAPDDVKRVGSKIHGVLSAARAAADALSAWTCAMRQGSMSIERTEEGKVLPKIKAQSEVAKLLARSQLRPRRSHGPSDRERVVLMEQYHTRRGVATRAWKVHRHETLNYEMTIEDFVVHVCSHDVNPHLHLLCKGDTMVNIAKAVTESMSYATHYSFLPVQMHRHAFAFEDGIYIAFIHSGCEYGMPAYDQFWAAMERGATEDGEAIHRTFRDDRICAPSCGARWRTSAHVAVDVFLSFAQAEMLLPAHFSVTNYFPVNARGPMRLRACSRVDEWQGIDCKYMDYITKCQWGDPGISPEDTAERRQFLLDNEACDDLDKHYRDVMRVFMGALGRMFFPVTNPPVGMHELDARLDDFETVLFLFGKGGTGKSAIGMTVLSYMNETEIGTLANRSEEQFWGQNLINKRVVSALELKDTCNFDQANLQTAASGEQMAVSRKGKDPWLGRWSAPIICAANTMPVRWTDPGGALTRRLMVFNFKHDIPGQGARVPVRIDGALQSLAHKSDECAALLRRMYCAYLTMVSDFGSTANPYMRLPPSAASDVASAPQSDFDGYVLPKSMHMWKRDSRESMDTMRTFCFSPEVWKHLDLEHVREMVAVLGHGPKDGSDEAAREADALAETLHAALTTTHIDTVTAAAKVFVEQNGGSECIHKKSVNQHHVFATIAAHQRSRLRSVTHTTHQYHLCDATDDNGARRPAIGKKAGRFVTGAILSRCLEDFEERLVDLPKALPEAVVECARRIAPVIAEGPSADKTLVDRLRERCSHVQPEDAPFQGLGRPPTGPTGHRRPRRRRPRRRRPWRRRMRMRPTHSAAPSGAGRRSTACTARLNERRFASSPHGQTFPLPEVNPTRRSRTQRNAMP